MEIPDWGGTCRKLHSFFFIRHCTNSYFQWHSRSFEFFTPISTIIVGILFFQQRGNFRVFAGAIVGLMGTGILIYAGNDLSSDGFNAFGLLVMLASVLYAFNGNLIKFRLGDVPALMITSISLCLGGMLSGIYLALFTDFFSSVLVEKQVAIASGYIAMLGVLGTAVALVIFNRLVQLTSPVFTSSVTYIIPLVALMWGLIDGEALTLFHLMGVLMILLGVYITTRKGRK